MKSPPRFVRQKENRHRACNHSPLLPLYWVMNAVVSVSRRGSGGGAISSAAGQSRELAPGPEQWFSRQANRGGQITKTGLEPLGMGAWLRESARRLSGLRWLRLTVLATLAALVLGGVGGPDSGPALLDRLGSWPGYGRGPAADVAVANHYAFVAIEEGGLLVLDITDTKQAPARSKLSAGGPNALRAGHGRACLRGNEGGPGRRRLRIREVARAPGHS